MSANKINRDFRPDLFHPYYFIRGELYRNIKAFAPKLNGEILDFGCGAKPYKDLFTNCKSYTGVDFEGAGHSHKDEEIDYYYDGNSLPFQNNQFDCVFSSEVFEHLFNLPEILPEINRVVKTGGLFLITCPFAWPEHEKPYDYARYTLFALTSMLEKNGFRVVETAKSGNFFLATHQLTMVYFYHHVFAKFSFNNKLPWLATLVRKFMTPIMNAGGIIGNAILPSNKDFYMNNIVLAEKIST